MIRSAMILLACAGALAARDLPAFPGAEGFGATTPGGRGGKVLPVTNLNDSGPGSLRAACEAEGPRIVVFRVDGMIDLKSAIRIRNPYLTLAGQTAPGDGICLRGYEFSNETHDVVVRFLRSRPGDIAGKEVDALDLGHGSRNVVYDHCSANWSVDECLSLSGLVSDVTVQWCLIGESLNRSVHKKGAHGYGSLSRASGGVSWHHNLWLHNTARNPRLGDNYGKAPYPTFDVRNNVMYDFGGTCSGLTQGVLKVNYAANYIKPGPSSGRSRQPIVVGGPSDMVFYIRDNYVDGNPAMSADNATMFTAMELDGKRAVTLAEKPFEAPLVRTLTPQAAYDAVLAQVGAYLPVRDAVDSRLVEHVRTRTGAIINSQKEVGGWPVYRTAKAPVDSDGDGMPDAWEKAHGLDPRDASDAAKDRDGDGYTNIEEYINSLVRAPR
jgi:hypothetical protein